MLSHNIIFALLDAVVVAASIDARGTVASLFCYVVVVVRVAAALVALGDDAAIFGTRPAPADGAALAAAAARNGVAWAPITGGPTTGDAAIDRARRSLRNKMN